MPSLNAADSTAIASDGGVTATDVGSTVSSSRKRKAPVDEMTEPTEPTDGVVKDEATDIQVKDEAAETKAKVEDADADIKDTKKYTPTDVVLVGLPIHFKEDDVRRLLLSYGIDISTVSNIKFNEHKVNARSKG